MITVNKYIQLIEGFLKTHSQINTVVVGNEFNFNAQSNIVYPVAHVEYQNQTIRGENKVDSFKIIVADIFDNNIKNHELEIISDCSLIADDIVTYFENQINEDYEIANTVSVSNFNNGNIDRIAGVVFVINFTQFRKANDCLIPIVNDPLKGYKMGYLFYSSNPDLSAEDINHLLSTSANNMNGAVQDSIYRKYKNVTANPGMYTYIMYDACFGDAESIIMGLAMPILGAFQQKEDKEIINEGGNPMTVKLYRTNITQAFTDAILEVK